MNESDAPATSSPGEAWQPAPPGLRLRAGEVHVWRASAAGRDDSDAAALERLWAVLAPDERRRAESYRFERDRLRYVFARAVLRDILGRYLGVPAAHVRLAYDDYGKPALAANPAGVHFNLSHSHDAALYACALGPAVGVDVERLRDDFACLDTAERFFSRAEFGALRALPAGLRTRAFFNCWTRKEAYIKALGEGLSHPLDCFAVSLAPGEPACLVSTDRDPREAAEWSLVELNPFPGYAAALAVRSRNPVLRLWDWRAAAADQ